MISPEDDCIEGIGYGMRIGWMNVRPRVGKLVLEACLLENVSLGDMPVLIMKLETGEFTFLLGIPAGHCWIFCDLL
jgi:hypothetical protein